MHTHDIKNDYFPKFSSVYSGFGIGFFFKFSIMSYKKMKVNPHDSSFIPFSAPKASATYNIHTFNRFPFQLLFS